MTEADRRLAALAAAVARERAAGLLARHGAPGAADAAAHARTLADAPRADRLRALAAALAGGGAAPAHHRAEAADQERPRVAAILAAVATGVPGAGAAALLVRLCRERLAR
jgi:hypothetical protein